METYTHNLKIILFDNSENIILDNDFLDEIKYELCKFNTTNVKWNTKKIPISIQWHKKELNNIDKHFMGDLFTNSIYNFDSCIVEHTKQIMSKINNKSNYIIKFYISGLIGNRTICKDSFGVV